MKDSLIRSMKPLVLMLKFNEVDVNVTTLIHKYALESLETLSVKEYILVCKGLDVKCKYYKLSKKKLRDVQAPFVFIQKDGLMNIVIRMENEQVFYMDLDCEQPKSISITQFLSIWDGGILLFKKKGFMNAQEIWVFLGNVAKDV